MPAKTLADRAALCMQYYGEMSIAMVADHLDITDSEATEVMADPRFAVARHNGWWARYRLANHEDRKAREQDAESEEMRRRMTIVRIEHLEDRRAEPRKRQYTSAKR